MGQDQPIPAALEVSGGERFGIGLEDWESLLSESGQDQSNLTTAMVAKDSAFCLCRYLFKPDIGDQAGGDSFVGEDFSNWKKKEKIQTHVGGPNSAHNQASNVKVVALSNAPQNVKLTSPDIQKHIVNVAAFETINVIIRDLGDALFSILIDDARDISIKEHMAVVIRYVDKKGQVIKRFLGIEHVTNTNALSLKQAVENLFSKLGLSIFRLWGHGYNGASNMQYEFNGLKTLILKENPCAYYVHCFAHQLQLEFVAVAKNHDQIVLLFTLVSNVVNVVGASCKCRDIIREKQAAKVAEALNTRELSSRQGLNQETNLKGAGDTCWGSHYGTLVSLAGMFSIVIDVLEMILENGSNSKQRA
ncbi:uncharacterized protein LOC114280017 [Camellia sinensis]|uniref:uncharacterized protein LOC114280017 n=1 Tax=Camellia sinensis TaxID=4442 RepID=UPI00103634F4|nr:uncharacterized protein LOC114280017 [Camellia sinensis]